MPSERSLPDDWHRRRKLKSADATLGASGGVEAIPQLVRAMTNKKEQIRQAAAWSLGQIAHPDALPALLAALHDTDWLVRRNAITALAKIGHAGAVPRLVTLLNDDDPRIVAEALSALGALNAHDATADIEAFKEDDRFVRLPKFEKTIGEIAQDVLQNLTTA